MTEDLTITAQAVSFLLFVLGGVLLGAFYDFIKTIEIRYFFKKTKIRWYDLVTAALIFIFVLLYFLIVNNLKANFYCFAGMIAGIVLYLSAFSGITKKLFEIFLIFFEKFLKILLYPVKILCIIVKKIILFMVKILSLIIKPFKKLIHRISRSLQEAITRAKKV